MKEHDIENILTTSNNFETTNQIQCLRCTNIFTCGEHYNNNSFSRLQF